MIVAIPFFPGYTDYGRLTVSINSHGICGGHRLLVMSRRVDEEAAMDFEQGIADSFSGSVHRVVDQPREQGKFATTNEMFRQSLWYLKNYRPERGETEEATLLYFEPILRISKKGWADAIQSEYYAKGMPQALACQKGRADGYRGTWGAVLFNRDYVQGSALLAHLPSGQYWREYLRHEINHHLVVSETLFPKGPKSVVTQAHVKSKKAEDPKKKTAV